MRKILLINPPYPGKTGDPSMSLGYLGRMIEKSGYSCYVWDGAVLYSYRDKFDEVMQMVKTLQPDLIGFTLTTPFVRFAYTLAHEIRDKFNIPMIAGGVHPSLCADEVLEKAPFEIAVLGEADYTIQNLNRYYFNKDIELKNIPGIAYKTRGGNVVYTDPRPLIQNLDDIPFPLESQSILKNNKGGVFAQILTSRGCPAKCTFCGSLVHGKQFRFRSAGNVFEEISHLYKKYGVTHFHFQDDALTINQQRLDKLCDIIIGAVQLKLTWFCQSRADALNPRLLKKMKDAGCVMIDIGLESASPRIMEKINKRISLEKVLETIENCHNINLPLNINIMTGFPFETEEDISYNIKFMKNISKNIARLNVGLTLKPYPGTEIYDTYRKEYDFTQWWLSDKYTLSENTDYIPLYLSGRLGSWTLPEDPTLDIDFFKYSPGIKKKIKKFIWYKSWFSMRKCHGIFKSIVLLVLYYISKSLYKTVAPLERILMPMLLKVGQLINHGLEIIKRKQLNLRPLYFLFIKRDRFIKYILNRLAFLFCMPLRGWAGWPVAFYISINSKCNFKCKTCDIGQRQADSYLYKNMAQKDELTLDQWKVVVDKIAYLRPHMDISAAEPLLYKDILGVIRYIKNDKKLSLSLTTNGFLLEKYAQDLVNLKVDIVSVSIDGPLVIHDKIRGVEGAFDHAIKGIKALISNKNRPCVAINFTISDHNHAYLLETIDYLSGLFEWDIFRFIHLSFATDHMAKMHNRRFKDYPATSGDISAIDLDKIDTEVLEDQIKEITSRYKNKKVMFHPDIPFNKIAQYYNDPSRFVLRKRCILPWVSASILSDGDIIALDRCPGNSFGNLLDNDFRNIWNNRAFREFRMSLRKEGAFAICARCGGLKIK